MSVLKVNLQNNGYKVHIGNEAISKLKKVLEKDNKYFVIADNNAFINHGKQFIKQINKAPADIIFVKGEKDKNLKKIEDILIRMTNVNITRSDYIVSFGGGVCGDVAGFCASIYMRGVKYFQVPTTLLAQVDSSVGGKCGVNLLEGKNLIGSFYQPSGVYIDKKVLETLNDREIKCGKAEVIKTLLIKDKNLVNQILEGKDITSLKFITSCVDIKKTIVEKDQFDVGERMLLNFGHTIGHAIEAISGYGKMSHGQAIAIGMALITKMSEKYKYSEKGTYKQVIEILKVHGLEYEYKGKISDLFKYIKNDKKNLNNKINLVLLKSIGNAYIYTTSLVKFYDMLENL